MENWKDEALERMARYVVSDCGRACTGWNGGKDQDGYPMFWFRGKTLRAARVLWAIVYGEIPEGLIVRHTCDVPECLNIGHLLLGTHKQNTGDALARGRMRGPRKIDEKAAQEINDLRREGMKVADIARRYSVDVGTVYNNLDRELVKSGNYARGERHWNHRGGT